MKSSLTKMQHKALSKVHRNLRAFVWASVVFVFSEDVHLSKL